MRLVFVPALLSLALLGGPGPVHATSRIASPGCLQTADQSGDCAWSGTISLTRNTSDSKTMQLVPQPNSHGGTITGTSTEHDATMVEIDAGQASATRERAALNTTSRHDLPGAQCGPGQPLTYGTHDSISQRRETQQGSAQGQVQVDLDPIDGTFTVTYPIPEPATTTEVINKETWGLCNAPKPQNTDTTSTQPGGSARPVSFTGTLGSDDVSVLDGSHTDHDGSTTTTITWHLTSSPDCDRYQQELATESAALMAQSTTVHAVLDQLADEAVAALPESPELTGATADLGQMRTQFDGQYDSGVLGDPNTAETQAADQAYADALLGWYQSQGIGDLALISAMAPLPQSGGQPRTLTLSASPMADNLQTALQQLQADRLAVKVTQLLLGTCQTGG